MLLGGVPEPSASSGLEPLGAAVASPGDQLPSAISGSDGAAESPTAPPAPSPPDVPSSAGAPEPGLEAPSLPPIQAIPSDAPPAAAFVAALPAPSPFPAPAAPEERAGPATDPASESAPVLSLLEQAAAARQERLRQLTAPAQQPPAVAVESADRAMPAADHPVSPEPQEQGEGEPSLGAFDEAFTWSAEVLAAQGRRVEDVSIEEIDWLTRLRRGLEKTRRGFVTQLLETLGDDPLSPEVLDDLETTLLQADVGVQATDLVLDALRRRLNEEVVDPSEGLRFLKEQLRQLLDAPCQRDGRPVLAPSRDRLNIWLLVGVNGVGKTTTLGKLANLAVRSGYSCLIAAADKIGRAHV